jgi:hypothetical protein
VALRQAARPGHCAIVALGGVSDPGLARAMEGAADDVLPRPFGSDAFLLHRLRQAARSLRCGGAPPTPREALDEALQSTSGGEVVVRCGEIVGHVHVQNGFVVWANLSSVPSTMEEVLGCAGVDVGAEILTAVKDECRSTRAHFMDVLVAWKIIAVDQAKDAVRVFVAERVGRVLELPGAAALFLPKARQHTEHLRFGVGDIPSLRQPAALTRSIARFSTPPPSSRMPLPLAQISKVFQAAQRIEGVVSVAILERKTGASLLLSGAAINTGIAWSQLSLLEALGPTAEDVFGSASEHGYVTRPLQVAPELAVFVVLAQAATTLGLARVLLARLAGAASDRERDSPAVRRGPIPDR